MYLVTALGWLRILSPVGCLRLPVLEVICNSQQRMQTAEMAMANGIGKLQAAIFNRVDIFFFVDDE